MVQSSQEKAIDQIYGVLIGRDGGEMCKQASIWTPCPLQRPSNTQTYHTMEEKAAFGPSTAACFTSLVLTEQM